VTILSRATFRNSGLYFRNPPQTTFVQNKQKNDFLSHKQLFLLSPIIFRKPAPDYLMNV